MSQTKAQIEFFGGQKFTGRTTYWTEFARCDTCEEKFVGRGKTEKAAHADAEHWAAFHRDQCTGEGW